MIPEDLLFWISPIAETLTPDPNVLCRRHADAMVVPRGWTLDDRRELLPRLFKPPKARPSRVASPEVESQAPAARRRPATIDVGEQLQIDGTGPIERPVVPDDPVELVEPVEPIQVWQPEFDVDDDLNGLLEVDSPLLSRAFRGTERRRG
jgi:hypothetical protein